MNTVTRVAHTSGTPIAPELSGLGTVMRKSDGPDRQARAWKPMFENLYEITAINPGCYREGVIESLPRTQAGLCCARRRLLRLPPWSDLMHWRLEFHNAATEPADDATMRAIVALTLDAKRNAKISDHENYLDALLYVLEDEGFSAAVLAGVARQIWTEHTFVPEIAEYIPLLRDKREFFEWCSVRAMEASEAVEQAQDLLDEFAGRVALPAATTSDDDEIPF